MLHESLDDQVHQVARLLAEAPFDPETWSKALERVAVVTGGWGAQLIGVSGGELLFHVDGGIATDVLEEFEQRQAANPAVSPRATALVRAREGEVLSEPDFIDESERRRHPFYQEFLDRVDTPYSASSILTVEPELRVLSVILRAHNQGPANSRHRALLQVLSPHMRAAARLQLLLEEQAAGVGLRALDALTVPAILCDFTGRVSGVSREGERVLSDGVLLTLADGRLRAVTARCDRDLQAALTRACTPRTIEETPASTILLTSRDGTEAMAADITPLPRKAGDFGISARAMVVVGGPRRHRPNDALIRLGLTKAEADVARLLAAGHGRMDIAALRRSNPETVKAQTQAVYRKLDVRRQAELAVKLRHL